MVFNTYLCRNNFLLWHKLSWIGVQLLLLYTVTFDINPPSSSIKHFSWSQTTVQETDLLLKNAGQGLHPSENTYKDFDKKKNKQKNS